MFQHLIVSMFCPNRSSIILEYQNICSLELVRRAFVTIRAVRDFSLLASTCTCTYTYLLHTTHTRLASFRQREAVGDNDRMTLE